jgi:hypothetical protein
MKFQYIFNANMIHSLFKIIFNFSSSVSPWATCEGLMRLSKNHLEGYLFIYGPFNVDGKFTSEGNEKFDAWLKEKNELFGVRNYEDVVEEAKKNDLEFVEKISMPSNNFILVFRKK